MTERNQCVEIGCTAACCRNISGQTAGRSEFFLRAFPNAQLVSSEEELTVKLKNQENGVYYYEERGWTYFAISGNCPNLMSDFSCKIHEENYYPNPCQKMIVNSNSCETSQFLYLANRAKSQQSPFPEV